VKSFPGLMRLITWVLTGLRLEVHRASLRTDLETGIENDLFYITDEKGGKVQGAGRLYFLVYLRVSCLFSMFL
jgi:UTP:GlnB (protein PII) uridylyltransferase